MKTKLLFSLAGLATLALLAPSPAATVPAGTVLVTRTVQAIASVDLPGTLVPMQLQDNVAVNGKVVLPAGTKVSGKVQTSRRFATSSERLTVNITDLQIGGRAVPIKTTGAVQVTNENFKTLRGTPVGRASYSVPAGRRLQFRLAQPLQL